MKLWKPKQRRVMDKPTPDEPLAEWELQLLASDGEPVFVETYRSARGDTVIEDRDGVSWYDAPTPPLRHKCEAQTKGWLGLSRTYRCACGAISSDGRNWYERNSR